ncbi:MAG: archaetidylserine decarboxylase [Lysobacterales bacterium]
MRWTPLKNLLIRMAIKGFGIDMSQAAEQSLAAYPTFNAFFTRPLREDARPRGQAGTLLCPADGAISQLGPIRDGRIIQAKGHDFSVEEFVTPRLRDMGAFDQGAFITIYLSPKDYHRVHMPWTGTLAQSIYVPGKLFSVSPVTTAAIPRLFARNERLISLFDCDFGPMVVALVGAVCVSSMDTVWEGTIAPADAVRPQPHSGPTLAAGEEMGRFNMGSTAIVLLPPGVAQWRDDIAPMSSVQMGQSLAHIR